MKIIQLGHLSMTFTCQKCKTVWEMGTEEIKFEQDGFYWYVECPLCEHRIKFNDCDDVVKFLKKRKEITENEIY